VPTKECVRTEPVAAPPVLRLAPLVATAVGLSDR